MIAAAVDLPKKMIQSIHTSAGKLRDVFPDIDELMSTEDACDKIGIGEKLLRGWRRAGWLPSETHGTKIFYRTSICIIVKKLRSEHGNEWFEHVPWTINESSPIVASISIDRNEFKEDVESTFVAKLLRRGINLFYLGRQAEAAAVLVAAIEEGGLMSDEASQSEEHK